jgi:thiol-disulfide isomerase/thioredoxin
MLLLFNLLVFLSIISFAQEGKVPPFKMLQANGKVFKAQDLPMGKPIILIYFSPDCDHCNAVMKDLVKYAANLKKASIAMITYLPVAKVAAFIKKYSVKKYPNLYVGTEGSTFFVRNYYGLTEMPFAALYTSNGDLVSWYTKNISIQNLISKLNNLK